MGNEIFGTGILIAVFVTVLFIVLRTAVKRLAVKRKCCGGRTPEKREEKILETEPIFEITVQIEGLCCEDCAIRVENAFNRMEGVAAKASYEEKRAVLLLCRELGEKEICSAVEGCGFAVAGIQIRRL